MVIKQFNSNIRKGFCDIKDNEDLEIL